MSSTAHAGNSILLLCEAGDNELHTVYENYFKETHVNNWKILDVLKKLFITYKPSTINCISIFKRSLKYFASNYKSNDARLKLAMTKLLDNCDKVLASNPARLILSEECIVQLNSVYNSSIVEEIIKDKYRELTSDPLQQPIPVSVLVPALPLPNSPLSSKRGSNENSVPFQEKKLRRLSATYLNTLSLNEKLSCLTCSYGKNNILDLSSPGIIPHRLASIIKEIASKLTLVLPLVYSPQEREILIKISRSTSLNDIEVIAKSISLIPRTGLQSYLYISLSKLLLLYQSNQLLDTTHKEGWFQGHVYADTFDAVFLFDPYYITKRTECQASTIKYLRKMKQIDGDEKDVKVDLILFNSQLGDVFSCEDKPTSATETEVEADIKKASNLREKRLKYIQSLLPYPSCIQHIEVISAQFHGLILTVYGSRMTKDGIIIHYQKSTATIPSQASNMSQLAYFLLTVMSLQRTIIINLKKLICIYETRFQDSIGFLVSPFNSTNNNIIFREDSPEPSSNSNSNENDTSLDTIGDNWIEVERASRVLMLIEERIKEIGYGDGVLTCDDWESIISL